MSLLRPGAINQDKPFTCGILFDLVIYKYGSIVILVHDTD